jgi:8-oxo-dGTP pyrophosphatase MutT (NUDIX family)
MANEAVARPAATILLLRDGAHADGGKLEVFMVVRHHAIDFASGALVFPGGRVDGNDHALAADIALCPNPHGVDAAEMAFRVAAIRETFEECGVLLARPIPGHALIGAQQLLLVEAAHRSDLAAGKIAFGAVLRHHGLTAATDLLTQYAHWITPSNQPKRYDTRFFLAVAPEEHLAVHDGTESVDSIWISPSQVLADAKAGRFKLVFATEMNLTRLARQDSVEATIAEARRTPIVTVLPRVIATDGTRRTLILPVEAGYGGPEFIVENAPAS